MTGDANTEKHFHFHVENYQEIDALTGAAADKKRAVVSNEAGESMTYEIVGDFDVRVTTGSSLPFAKAEKTNMSMQLFDRQVIDNEELLKNLDYPNYEEVLRRMEIKKQADMQQQMAMQQQQAMQGPPPKGPPAPSGPPAA